MTPAVAMTIRVTPAVHAGLQERAREIGAMTTEAYAALLLEAAYAARIGQETGTPCGDDELDVAVRLALACAGVAEADEIAAFLGLPETLVGRILDGWRRAPTQTRPARPRAAAAVDPVPAPRRSFVAAPARPAAAPPPGLTDNEAAMFAAIATACGDDEAELSRLRLRELAPGIAEGSVVYLCNRLAQRGYIAVSPPAEKGGAKRYRLTAKGRAARVRA